MIFRGSCVVSTELLVVEISVKASSRKRSGGRSLIGSAFEGRPCPIAKSSPVSVVVTTGGTSLVVVDTDELKEEVAKILEEAAPEVVRAIEAVDEGVADDSNSEV